MAASTPIPIKPIEFKYQPITIIGTTPLIVHAWSHKVMEEMLDKQRGKAKGGAKHDIKIPVNDFMESLYWLTDKPPLGNNDKEAEENWISAVESGAKFGFPVTGIKQSIASGAYRAGITKDKVSIFGAFYLEGSTECSTTDIAEVVADAPVMRQDMVRVGNGAADIRFRPEFERWEIPVMLKYNAKGQYSLEQLLNLINYGGFSVGIGEWRPEKKGQFGMYQLKTD